MLIFVLSTVKMIANDNSTYRELYLAYDTGIWYIHGLTMHGHDPLIIGWHEVDIGIKR
jgi:hypothetical protein